MTTNTATKTIGTIVSYEDMGNPLRFGEITEIRTTKYGTEFLVEWADGGSDYSTCTQRGWKVR